MLAGEKEYLVTRTELQEELNKKLDTDGDSKDNITTFTSSDSSESNEWTNVEILTSKEKHSSILSKVSQMFKNIRYLWKLMGTTDISAIGDGTLTGAIESLDTNKLDNSGDSKDNTTSFTSFDSSTVSEWTDVSTLTSGEKHSSIFSKMSQMFKNIRYLWKLMGTTDISSIGDGTVTDALSSLNNNKLGKNDAAVSANKLNTDAGSATQPVYFNNGIPVAGTYSLNKTVPSDAKFTDTTYSNATTSANGLMSSTDKSKLDGIAANANNYSHPTSSGNKHIPSGGSSGQILRWSADGTAAWGADNNTTYSNATTSANGLMSSTDKSKLDGIAANANNYSLPTATSSVLGGVKVGSNITLSSGTISLSKSNVTSALGYTPPTANTDTKNTAGSTDTSSKIFLVGATSQAVNPQTYSHDTAYVGTDGCVYSGGKKTSVDGHTHNYAGSSSAGGAATSANKINTNAGSGTNPVYFADGIPKACSYSLNKTVPSNAVFTDTNTWRGIQNNLTSTSTSDSLSAYQGKLLNDKINSLIGVVSATIKTLSTRLYVDMPSGFNLNNSIVVGYRFGSTYNLDYITNSTVAVYWQHGDPNNRISFRTSADAVLGKTIYIYFMKISI